MAVELDKSELDFVDSIAQVFLSKALPEKSVSQENVQSLVQYAYSAALKALKLRNEAVQEKVNIEEVPPMPEEVMTLLNEEDEKKEVTKVVETSAKALNKEITVIDPPEVKVEPEVKKKKAKKANKKKTTKKKTAKVKVNPLSSLDDQILN